MIQIDELNNIRLEDPVPQKKRRYCISYIDRGDDIWVLKINGEIMDEIAVSVYNLDQYNYLKDIDIYEGDELSILLKKESFKNVKRTFLCLYINGHVERCCNFLTIKEH